MSHHTFDQKDVQRVMSVLRPGQQICVGKLAEQLGWPLGKLYPVKRWLQEQGFVTERRRYHKPSIITFHNPALPPEHRQTPGTRRSTKVPRRSANGPWAVRKTFELKEGVYTAEELETLAVTVCCELGYKLR